MKNIILYMTEDKKEELKKKAESRCLSLSSYIKSKLFSDAPTLRAEASESPKSIEHE